MSNEIKVGDTVELKSGGPVMTVSSIGAIVEGGKVYAYCDWFEGSKNMQASFPLTSVKVVDM
jgi:uncharacterized protein YodC (DUF2158 family)